MKFDLSTFADVILPKGRINVRRLTRCASGFSRALRYLRLPKLANYRVDRRVDTGPEPGMTAYWRKGRQTG